MGEFKGTKGTWRAASQTFLNGQTGDQGVHWWIVGPNGQPLPMAAGRNMVSAAECEANARLMAAAPKLLDALADLAGGGFEAWGDHPCLEYAKRIIAEALGEG